MPVIPFYGAEDPGLFDIERRAMDRPGLVIDAVDERLPHHGTVLDVGAGDGFTAVRLQSPARRLVALEPADGMRRPNRPLTWVAGDAAHLPFVDSSVDAAYSTWAYFFSRGHDPTPGIAELDRVVRPGGPLVIVDNLGGDEFTALGDAERLSANAAFWEQQGFERSAVETVFEFESAMDATALLTAYFGPDPRHASRLLLTYRVGLFVRGSRGGTG